MQVVCHGYLYESVHTGTLLMFDTDCKILSIVRKSLSGIKEKHFEDGDWYGVLPGLYLDDIKLGHLSW